MLQEMIRAVTVASLDVSDHEVSESIHMARSLEHNLRGDSRTFELKHALFKDEMLPPRLSDVLLDGTARRAVVVEAGDTVVDLERRDVEEPPFQDARDGSSEGLLVL